MPQPARPLSVADLSAALHAVFNGDGSTLIIGAGSLEAAGPGELSYVDGPKNFGKAKKSRCSVLIAPEEYEDPSKALIRTAAPRLAFARALGALYPEEPAQSGIHPSTSVAASAQLGADVAIGAYSVVGERCRIGAGTQIADHVVVSHDVVIGERCLLYAGVRVYPWVRIGRECILHSGAVVGSDGLGFVLTESGYEKYPQRGAVVVGDRVEIGANTTIDRGSIEDTVIGNGTKLDNLIHIAHNCIVGENCIIAAQTGVAGSTVIGNRVTIGGQVGIADHCTIEDGAIIGAQAGVPTGKRIRANTMVWGTPARPMSEFREQYKDILSIKKIAADLARVTERLAELKPTGAATELKPPLRE